LRNIGFILFSVLILGLSFVAFACAQTGNVYFKEEFSHSNLDQMQAAGWTFTRPAGISVGSGTVVLDGVEGDCAIHYNSHFSAGIFDWKVESKSMWLGQGHTTNGVHVSTERHSYSFSADGYYDEFAFYRDNVKILHFGIYQETANQYFVMTMVRQANTFSLYFNGELKNTYIEEDKQQSAATGIALVSPWRGDAKYDYYQLGEPTAVFTSSNPTVSTDSFPMVPVLIGGGITAAVVGGIVVYYFFIAGGSSASAGASAGVGSAGAGSPLSGEGPLSPLAGQGGFVQEQMSNVTQTMSILQDMVQNFVAGNSSAISAGASSGGTLANSNIAPTQIGLPFGGHAPVPTLNNIIDALTSQGQQLVNQGTNQNSIDQGNYQQYLENCTNLLDMLTNITNTQHETNTNIIQNIDGGGNPSR
jgi:hypothetical protein